MGRSFNGTTDFIETTSNVVFTTSGNKTYTVSFWFNINSISQAYSGLFLSANGANGPNIYVKSTGAFAVYLQNTGNNASADPLTGATVNISNWHHFVLSYSGTVATIYFDGSSVNTISGTATVAVTDNFIFGKDPGAAGRFFPGSVTDIAIWTTNLSSGNVTSLFNGVRPVNVNSANLNGWWPLDGYASPETDLSTNADTMTLTGTSRVLGAPALWRISA